MHDFNEFVFLCKKKYPTEMIYVKIKQKNQWWLESRLWDDTSFVGPS